MNYESNFTMVGAISEIQLGGFGGVLLASSPAGVLQGGAPHKNFEHFKVFVFSLNLAEKPTSSFIDN